METPLFFILFLIFIGSMLALDLGVFHRKDEKITLKNATIWTLIWILIATLFGALIWKIDGSQKTLEYFSGYLIEKVLSMDNIFVMILIFTTFNIDVKYYHRILFYGILGAIVFRFIFIFVAAALIHRFEWILVIFGVILIYSAVKMFLERNQPVTIDLEKNKLIRFFSKRGLVTSEVKNHDFFTKINGKLLITPLFLVLLMIEISDVIFAVDSVPAVFGVTRDPYIVFYSNIFAILGLRSLFFVISNIMSRFKWLQYVLMLLLLFIGVKMIVGYFVM
ncbi:MAG: TerC/Alx family metal homeostasis membrane protein [Bacteroidetes bacterium]|nr:TerC/Alx family metal homeostasis membrane protein [Bacteroidota bacterium]MCL1969655.1 TerC/Alx family metal homeostasis membrane protein [Bacteroidota bacterium]